MSISTACFPLGERRGSQGQRRKRTGEAWTGRNRWRDAREHGVLRKRVACTNLITAEGCRVHFCSDLFCLRDNHISERYAKVVLVSIEHPIVFYICGHRGSVAFASPPTLQHDHGRVSLATSGIDHPPLASLHAWWATGLTGA